MQKLILIICLGFTSVSLLTAQNKHIWALRAPGEAVEYDPATFAEKLTVKIPVEALASPQNFQINALGQMIFAPAVALPLTDGDFGAEKKIWFWNGHSAATLTRDISESHGHSGIELGHYRVGACAISFGGWSASILVLESGAPPAARWGGPF